MSRRVILWAVDQTATLPRSIIYDLEDINHFVRVVEQPVDLVVVTGLEVTHHVLVAIEEHDSHTIVQLVHLVEIWHMSRYTAAVSD